MCLVLVSKYDGANAHRGVGYPPWLHRLESGLGLVGLSAAAARLRDDRRRSADVIPEAHTSQ